MANSSVSTSTVRASSRALLLAALLVTAGTRADVYLTEGTNISVALAADGRIATDLLGSIWVIPPDGGEAETIASGSDPAHRPRWSPDNRALVYQSSDAATSRLLLYDFELGKSEPLAGGGYPARDADWHPDGERIVFSSVRSTSGFDLWEIDLETRIAWRLTDQLGDETEPAWSVDGRDLVYVHQHDGRWSLMLRRHGQPDQVLIESAERLAAPSWRPDGSLISYLKQGDDGWSFWMTILADPPLHRMLMGGEDFFLAPIAWRDRQHMVYASDGQLRQRRFDSWSSSRIPFRARVGQASATRTTAPTSREIPRIDEPEGGIVIRAARIYDGLGDRYRHSADIVIAGGEIVAIEEEAARPDAIVIDLGDVTVVPGFVDAYAALPETAGADLGPLLLALGITTMIADHPRAEELNTAWSGKELPGPRVLTASHINDATDSEAPLWLVRVSSDLGSGIARRDIVSHWQKQGVAVLADSWQAGMASGATLLLASGTRPVSPAGRRYQDVQLANGAGEITFMSGIADATTPGAVEIWRSRPARLIAAEPAITRRFAGPPDLSAAASSVVLGSQPNGLPPGIALHAELRALIAAGLSEPQALKAAGVNGALALGLGLKVGRVAAGAAADLLLIDGDPLERIDDALNIVGVVRNGRFYSVSGLIDRADQARTVD